MRTSATFVLAVLSACNFPVPEAARGSEDAGPNERDSATEPRCAFDFVSVCGKTASDSVVFAQSTIIDTSVGANCPLTIAQGSGAPELCLYYAKSIVVNAGISVRGVGQRALVFVAQESLTILGTLGVSSIAATSTQGESLGAGAEVAPCPLFTRLTVAHSGGGSGGAGGSAARIGGSGGTVMEGGGRSGGLPAAAIAAPNVLRGGCRGQGGGDSATIGAGGQRGPGGGALLLAARGTISIASSGRVTTGGGAGGGGLVFAGGGGGGSGGMLVFDGAMVANDGIVTATGGGGGQGGYMFNTTPFAGARGEDGRSDGNRADGGGNGLEPGQGGDGSGSANGNVGADSYDGAGGGGGGGGWIVVRGTRSGSGQWVPAPI